MKKTTLNNMRKLNNIARTIFLVVALSLAGIACGACLIEEEPKEFENDETRLLETQLTVDGLAAADALVHVEKLILPSLEVELAHESGVVVTSEVFGVEVEPTHGQATVTGPVIALPEEGKWDVILRVMPVEALSPDDEDGYGESSLAVYGLWFYGESASDPTPLPWRDESERYDVVRAAPFSYLSDAHALVELGEVNVLRDADTLELDLDFASWREHVLEPAVDALFADVQEDRGDAGGNDGHIIREGDEFAGWDRDNPLHQVVLDADGFGLSGLLERLSAHAGGPGY